MLPPSARRDPRGTQENLARDGFGISYNPMLTGVALSRAGDYQQGFNVNFIRLAFGLTFPGVCSITKSSDCNH
jgi:hypothetical protein